MSKAKRLVAGSVLGVINFFVTVFISLFMMPFLIKHLGDRMYGLWLLFGSFFGFYGLLDFGLSTAVQRYVSRAVGREDYEEANQVFNSSLVVFGLIGCVAILVSIGVSFFGHLFLKDPGELRLFRIIVVMIGCSLALKFPMQSFWALFSSHLRNDLGTIIELIKLICRTIFIVFFIGRGCGLLVFAVIMFVSDLGGYIANFFMSLKVAPYIRFSKKHIHLSQIRHLFGYSVYSFISKVAGNIKFNIDSFVIAGFLGLGSVTLYSVASRLIGYYMQFLYSIVGLVMPVFSQYEGQDNYDAIREKLFFMTKISGYTACLIGSVLVIFGKAFIQRWVGMEYAQAYKIMMVLLVPILLALIQSPSSQVLYGISKHKFLAIVSLIEAAFNLFLSLIFVRSYGLVGVALGTAIPLLVISISIYPIYVCKVLHIQYGKYFGEILRILCVSMVIFYISNLILNRFLTPTYLRISVLSGVYSLEFFICAFFFGFSKIEQAYLITVLKNFF